MAQTVYLRTPVIKEPVRRRRAIVMKLIVLVSNIELDTVMTKGVSIVDSHSKFCCPLPKELRFCSVSCRPLAPWPHRP